MNRRGILIELEGCDDSGASTVLVRLIDNFHHDNLTCVNIHITQSMVAPATDLHRQLQGWDDLIPDDLLSNYISAIKNRQDLIRGLLEDGRNVLIQRYVTSSLAYASTNVCDMNVWCRELVGVIQPDCTLFLDINPGEIRRRNPSAIWGGPAILDINWDLYKALFYVSPRNKFTERGTLPTTALVSSCYESLRSIVVERSVSEVDVFTHSDLFSLVTSMEPFFD